MTSAQQHPEGAGFAAIGVTLPVAPSGGQVDHAPSSAISREAGRVQVRLLGPLEVDVDGARVTLGGQRPRSLVALLALSPSVTVPLPRLVELLWGEEPPPAAVNTVQVYVSRLRKVLRPAGTGEPILVAGPAGYSLTLPDEAVDAVRFERLVDAGRRLLREADLLAAEHSLSAALRLWRCDELPDLSVLPTGHALASRLLGLRDAARADRADAVMGLGRYSEVVAELMARTDEQPLDERVAAQLITALYATGRQSDALAVHGRIAGRLAEELGVDPGPDLRRLHEQLLRHEVPVNRPAPAPVQVTVDLTSVDEARTSTPERGAGTPAEAGLTVAVAPAFLRAQEPLVGRLDELEAVLTRLAQPGVRLLTVTGAGGTGKTRLAREVAQAAAVADPRRPVLFVPLAAVTHPDDVLTGVAAAVLGTFPDHLAHGLTVDVTATRPDDAPSAAQRRDPLDVVRAGLGGRAALVVLDNLEQLVDAQGAPTPVATLLDAFPDLTVLATSRSVLHLRGEQLLALEPLPLPPAGCEDAAVVLASDAVRLFRQRARTVLPDFDVDPGNAAHVAEVVRLLDGLPLALELAAARVRVLPPRELAERMDRRLTLLTGGPRDAPERQRSMRAALDWSADLLDPAETLLFARVGAFHGGWTLEAAEQVCADGELEEFDVLDALQRLVDKSLVVADGSGRFTMLETIRVYAAERLAATPTQGRDVLDRHAGRMVALAEDLGPRSRHALDPQTSAALELEAANLQAALEHASAVGDGLTLGRLVVALVDYWFFAGRSRQATRWIQAAQDADVPATLRAEILISAGNIHLVSGAIERSVPLHRAALAAAGASGDPLLLMRAHGCLAIAARYAGRFGDALAEMDLAMAAGVEAGWEQGTPHLLNERGELLDELGRGAEADDHFETARRWAVDHDTDGVLAYVLANLAVRAQDRGRHPEALSLATQAVDAAQADGSTTVLGDVLPVVALVLSRGGHPEQALVLLRRAAAAAHAAGMLMTLTMIVGLLGAATLACGDALGAARVLAAARSWREARGLVQVGRDARSEVLKAELHVEDQLPGDVLQACRAAGEAVPFGQLWSEGLLDGECDASFEVVAAEVVGL